MKKKKITVEASPEHPDILDIRDAMQQVMDYFDLLTDQKQTNVVWNLDFASTKSPFTAEGSPVNLKTNAPAFDQVQEHVALVERGLIRIQSCEPLDDDFPAEKLMLAKRILNRNLNSIGRTTIVLGDDAVYMIEPKQAERSLEVINGKDDEEHDYLFSTFARKEYGSVEGRIIDLSTYYDRPSIKIREHRSGREIRCRISNGEREKIENKLTASDIWAHRRARISGVIEYDSNGTIIRVHDGRIAFIETKGAKIEDLHDPEFTGGLPAYEYIDKLRANKLG